MSTPALRDLMGGYFHQDWSTYGTEDDVIDQFMADQASLCWSLVPEIELVLASHPSERDLAQFVDELGCEYDPRERYGFYGQWLEAIADQARGH